MTHTALLDVNVLIALLDPNHDYHHKVCYWLDDYLKPKNNHTFATNPITQNGCIRILSQPKYPTNMTLIDIITRVTSIHQSPFHTFWTDNLSLLKPNIINWQYIQGHKQITDCYLLALAVQNKGILVTLDNKIQPHTVTGATYQHLCSLK